MAAEQYGRRLLDEVQTETLDELLKDLRNGLNQTSKDVLGIPSLDRLLEVFRYPQAAALARRPGWVRESPTEHNDMEDAEPEKHQILTDRPAILQISAQQSAAGKTTLLYFLAAKSLLPQEYGGKASIVVWIDTDGRFSAVRLFEVVTQLITNAPSAQDVAKTAIQQLYLFHPGTSVQLLSHLAALPLQPLDLNSFRPMSLLILDSATAFYQQDRFDADLSRLEAGPDYLSQPKPPSRTSQIIAALRTIQSRFECTIAFSTSPSPVPSSTLPQRSTNPRPPHVLPTARPSDQQFAAVPAPLPEEPRAVSPWSQFASLTLTLSRLPISRFAPNMSLEECLRDRDKRREAVAAGKFSINVDWTGAERWPAGVREKVEGMKERGRVDMVISAATTTADDGGGGVRGQILGLGLD